MIYNFDVWKSVQDVGVGKYTIAVFSKGILLVLVHFLFTKFWAKDSVKRMMIVNLVWFIASITIIIVLFTQTLSPGFTKDEKMVISKVKEELGAKRIEFVERGEGKYEIIVDRAGEYTVNISTYGEHIEEIKQGEKDVYIATKENIDDGVTKELRESLKKVRELSRNKDAKIKKYGYGDTIVKSGNELYEVGMDKGEVRYVIKKNDEYLYEK